MHAYQRIITIEIKISPQEEEDGSEDDSGVKPDVTVMIKSDFGVRSFLDQLEDDADGFISPVDDRIPSRSSQDMGLSNLHAASTYVNFFTNQLHVLGIDLFIFF